MNAEEIRAARHTLGLSQVALADALGLSPLNGRRAISRWEDGTVPVSGPAALAIRYMLKYGPLSSL